MHLVIFQMGVLKEMGAENRVEYSSQFDDYFELEPHDSELHEKFIDSYNEETFWEELTERLGKRDLVNQIGLEAYENMDGFERIERIDAAIAPYEDEFSNHGINNLKISGKTH